MARKEKARTDHSHGQSFSPLSNQAKKAITRGLTDDGSTDSNGRRAGDGDVLMCVGIIATAQKYTYEK